MREIKFRAYAMRRAQVKWRLDPVLLSEFRLACAELGVSAPRVVEALLRYFLRLKIKL